jgi:Fic family protein
MTAVKKENNHRINAVLQSVQHSSKDITEWLDWFLNCLKNAMLATEDTTQSILRKSGFWKLHENTPINERQRFMLNKLFDGFEGKLQTSKWAKMTKVSTDTALRDIKDLMEKDILKQVNEKGRNANYELTDFEWG